MFISDQASATSLSLICRVQRDDANAWQRLASLYAPLVYDWARKYGLQESDSRDVVQEVFHGLFTNIDRFEPQPDKPRFRAWLWGITRHKLVDHVRSSEQRKQILEQHRELELIAAGELLAESKAESGVEDTRLAHCALALLKTDFQEQTWRAFWRTTIDEVPASEVAAEMGMTPGAVRTAKCRVLSHLRAEFAGLL